MTNPHFANLRNRQPAPRANPSRLWPKEELRAEFLVRE
jgi:hypothetical protein